jgi:hypothetical protein
MKSSSAAVMFAPALAVALLPALVLNETRSASNPALSVPTITVGPGDGVNIQGSDIECAVSSSGPRAMVCGIGNKSLRPKSFAFTVADKGAAIFVTTGSQQVIARHLNPAVPGPAFAVALHKPRDLVLTRHEHVVVGGTHIACGSLPPVAGRTAETFGCGAYNTATGTAGYYVAGTYAVTISDQYIGILEAGKLGAQTVVVEEKQP